MKKPWFLNHGILIVLTLLLLVEIFGFTNYSSAQTKIEEYRMIDIGYVDCWRNSQGVWVEQTAWDGSKILTRPDITVDYGFRVPIPTKYRGKVFHVDVEFLNKNRTKYNNANFTPFPFETYEAAFDDHAVQNMTVTHSHNDDNYIYFTTRVTLTANEGPLSIRQDWQAPSVQGWRYYTPTHITLTAEVEEDYSTNDKVILKYQDTNGNTLRPDDAAVVLLSQGYNEVYPNTTKHNWILSQGYTLESPQPGYHYIYNSNQGTTHTKIFKYTPPPDAYITITGTANPNPVTLTGGQGITQNTVRGQVHNLPNGVNVISMKLFIKNNQDSQWVEQNFTSSNLIQQHNFGNFTISGTTTFPIKAEARIDNGRTITAEGQIIVQTEIPSLPGADINPDIFFDAWYSPIHISQKDFNNNVGQEINVFIDASRSTASEGIDKYHYRLKSEKSSWNDFILWTDWINDNTIGTIMNGHKVTIYPNDSDTNKKVKLEARTGVRDTLGNVRYSHISTKDLEFIIQVEPPETNLYLPEFFYPKQITNLGYKNVIGWDYYSEDNIPYKESIVSLYQLINDEPQLIFENQVMVNRELEVEGLPDEEFRIVTKVVDQLGNVSYPVEEDFVIMNASPIIQVTLDTSKENENLLGINVENITPSVIESIFPTRYSSWRIVDMNGITLDQGLGKTPEWVDLDERYYGNIATVIQYAENILGNQAQDRASYINNSIIDFVIDPDRLFEQEMTQVIDKTRMITNKKWQIQNTFGGELRGLLLNAANQFTQDEGKYNVFLFGDGRYAYQRNLYQYSNNKSDLRSILPITPTIV